MYTFVFVLLLSPFHVECQTSSKSNAGEPNDPNAPTYTVEDVAKYAKALGEWIYDTGMKATKAEELMRIYAKIGAEHYDPETEMDAMQTDMTAYMKKRADIAFIAKTSLEQRPYKRDNTVKAEESDPNRVPPVNRENNSNLVRYVNAKPYEDNARHAKDRLVAVPNDGAILPTWGADVANIVMQPLKQAKLEHNANLYNLSVDLGCSAVHVPVPVYNRSELDFFGKIIKFYFRPGNATKNRLV